METEKLIYFVIFYSFVNAVETYVSINSFLSKKIKHYLMEICFAFI